MALTLVTRHLLLLKDNVKGNKMVFGLLVIFHIYEELRFMMSPVKH